MSGGFALFVAGRGAATAVPRPAARTRSASFAADRGMQPPFEQVGEHSGKGALQAIRDDPKTPLSFDPIGLEIIVVDGENRGQLLPSRQMDQRGIGEVHGSVLI